MGLGYLGVYRCATLLLGLGVSVSSAQILDEDFNGVSGAGGVNILSGSGYNEVDNWDNGLVGEWAFAGTGEIGGIGAANALGAVIGGVGGTGAGRISVSGAYGSWTAGLFWPDLPLSTVDPSQLVIRADVKGSRLGGAFDLRFEGVRLIPFGIDEDFSTVTGTGGGTILAPGGYEGWTVNWDDGIDGEAAFAGAFGSVQIHGGVTVGGVTTIDAGGGVGSGMIRVLDITTGPGGTWWAGLVWEDQVLPSQNLAEVELRAQVWGLAIVPRGQTLGTYGLRLEDSEFDWLAFEQTATGFWQDVGGPLSTATEGGFGDGVFNPDAGPFKVVLVFENATWGTGGALYVDNLFFTGGFNSEIVGEVSFPATVTSTSTFQSVGGRLDTGISTFGNVDEGFDDTGTGTGGGRFWDQASGPNGYTPGWDEGLEGESAFAGYWGTVAVNGGADAYVAASGGADDGAAGVISVENVVVTQPGGWWAGLMWPDQQFPPDDLSQIYLTAKIKGVAGTGGRLGKYHLRVEDADKDYLGFVGTADGTLQEVGGPLSEAVEGTFIGDGTFHRNHGPFTVVVAFYDENASWGSGGTLIVDDLFFTSAPIGTGVDTLSAVVAFEDEAVTWGSSGALNVDNLRVTLVRTDADEDGDTDLQDAAAFLRCSTAPGGMADHTCLVFDFDGDNDVDAFDWAVFRQDAGPPM